MLREDEKLLKTTKINLKEARDESLKHELKIVNLKACNQSL